MREKIHSIQYLRGIAALLVVFTHVGLKMKQCGYEGFQAVAFDGSIGVDIFFVISGYVMCLTTARANRGSLSISAGFLKRRIVRIFPLYWVLTSCALCIYLIVPDQINQGGGQTVILESFLLLPTDGKFLVKNGWTLTYEMYFYLVFAGSLLAGRKVAPWLIGGLILGPVIFPALIPVEGALKDFLSDTLMVEFLYGVLLYQGLALIQKRGRQLSPWFGLSLCASAALWLVAGGFSHSSETRYLEFGIPALMICWGFIAMEPWVLKWRLRLFEQIGDSSYSLYLIHPFVLAFSRSVITQGSGDQLPQAALVFGVMVVLSVVGGYVCYLLIEDPAIKFFGGKPPREYLLWRYFDRVKGRFRSMKSDESSSPATPGIGE